MIFRISLSVMESWQVVVITYCVGQFLDLALDRIRGGPLDVAGKKRASPDWSFVQEELGPTVHLRNPLMPMTQCLEQDSKLPR